MQEKTDRRIQRTRKTIQDALVALISEKGYERITIQDIIDRANVGRSTFYAHYRDKEDLLLRGVAEIAYGDELDERVKEQIERLRAVGVTERLTVLPMLMHVKETEQIHNAMFKQSNENIILEKGTAYLYANISAQLSSLLEANQKPNIPIEFLAHYLTGGLIELCKWWLQNDTRYSPKEIDEMFQQIAMPGVLKALGKDGAS